MWLRDFDEQVEARTGCGLVRCAVRPAPLVATVRHVSAYRRRLYRLERLRQAASMAKTAHVPMWMCHEPRRSVQNAMLVCLCARVCVTP